MCHCCSHIVCETCMPVVGGDCLGCQVAFPAPCTLMPRGAPFDRMAISIDAHVTCSAIKSAVGQPDGFWDAHAPRARIEERHCHVSKSRREAQPPNSNKNENSALIVGMVQSCLQQIGVQQIESDYVVQNVKMCLDPADQAADKTSQMADPAHTKRSSVQGERNSKPITEPTCSPDKSKQKVKNGKKGGRTMMMCNVPCRVTNADFIEALDSHGFGSTYAFVHLPCRYMREDSNLGYGFVHFFRETDAERFALLFEGYHFSQKGSTKKCTIKVADCQGHDAHVRRLSKKVRQAQRQTP